jgi:hypothetical protein
MATEVPFKYKRADSEETTVGADVASVLAGPAMAVTPVSALLALMAAAMAMALLARAGHFPAMPAAAEVMRFGGFKKLFLIGNRIFVTPGRKF